MYPRFKPLKGEFITCSATKCEFMAETKRGKLHARSFLDFFFLINLLNTI